MEFWTIFWIVFIAELPCIIQTLGIRLQGANYSSIITATMLGTTSGTITSLIVGLSVAYFGLTWLKDTPYTHWLSGVIFIGLGVFMIWQGQVVCD